MMIGNSSFAPPSHALVRRPGSATCDTRRATARSPGHHGEILQGSFRRGTTIQRALVTLPCGAFWSEVAVELRHGSGRELDVTPAGKSKVRRAVALTLEAIGVDAYAGSVVVTSNIAPCRGYGSSTADVTAAIKAVLAACGCILPLRHIARLSVAAEGASDGTLWHRPVLFAQREGALVEDFGHALPAVRVLAFESVPGGAGVDTLALSPARYDGAELDEFATLRTRLRAALHAGDVRALGAVATASAAINQRHLPVPGFDDLLELARDAEAAGLQVSHSGDVAGLLFEDGPRAAAAVSHARDALSSRGLAPWQFNVGGRACRS